MLCGSLATLQAEETGGSLLLENVLNSLEGVNSFIPLTERGRKSYLHHTPVVSQAISSRTQ